MSILYEWSLLRRGLDWYLDSRWISIFCDFHWYPSSSPFGPLKSYQFYMQNSVTFHEFCVQLYHHVHIKFVLKQNCFSWKRECFSWYVSWLIFARKLSFNPSCSVKNRLFPVILIWLVYSYLLWIFWKVSRHKSRYWCTYWLE